MPPSESVHFGQFKSLAATSKSESAGSFRPLYLLKSFRTLDCSCSCTVVL